MRCRPPDRGDDPAPAVARPARPAAPLPEGGRGGASRPDVSGPGPRHAGPLRSRGYCAANAARPPEQAWRRAAAACTRASFAGTRHMPNGAPRKPCWPTARPVTRPVTTLRRAHQLAVDLQAAPLLVDIEALARTAAVVLDMPPLAYSQPPQHSCRVSPPGNGQVLTHVVAGRTYRQIAREMVISEKTSACTSPTCYARPARPTASNLPSWYAASPASSASDVQLGTPASTIMD
jgi:hypothetical protein